MKNILIILLLAVIPFVAIAQKRNKKNKDKNIDTNNLLTTANEFMVITIYEPSPKTDFAINKIKAVFDFHDKKNKDFASLSKQIYRSTSEVLTSASSYGWELVDVSVLDNGREKSHYFYMQRRK
jgi:hypothetical protein